VWPEAPGLPRRGFLAGALASLASLAPLSSLIAPIAGCGGATEPAAPPQPKLPPLKTERLTDLMALAGLRWLILLRPREIASIPWLIPPIAAVVPEENFTRFAATTGIDLRQLHEAVIATYAGAPDETTLYLGRHSGDPRAIERWVARRLTGAERRAADRPDLIRLSGKLGLTPYALALLGPDVFAIQHAGSISKGPARIASLYAEGKLKRSPTALSEDPLRALAARFGPAPLRAFALGPFEGELARGARGLLAGATAIGGAARPSAREGIALAIAVAGDFSTSGQAASEELLRAWDDLATGSFGHLLGLDRPVSPPLPTHAPDAVAIAMELDPRKLAAGLAAATSGQIADIMR
jgi:hypothetical protein